MDGEGSKASLLVPRLQCICSLTVHFLCSLPRTSVIPRDKTHAAATLRSLLCKYFLASIVVVVVRASLVRIKSSSWVALVSSITSKDKE